MLSLEKICFIEFNHSEGLVGWMRGKTTKGVNASLSVDELERAQTSDVIGQAAEVCQPTC